MKVNNAPLNEYENFLCDKSSTYLKDIRYCRATWQIVINDLLDCDGFKALDENYTKDTLGLFGADEVYTQRPDFSNKSHYRASISHLIVDGFVKTNKVLNFAAYNETLRSKCDNYLVDKEDLAWIDKNDPRICNFVYQNLKNADITVKTVYKNWDAKERLTNIKMTDFIKPIQARREPRSVELFIEPRIKEPISNEGKYKYIITTLDSLELTKSIKSKFLYNLRCTYELRIKNYSFKKLVSDDPKKSKSLGIDNEALCQWAYNYVYSALVNKKVFYKPSDKIKIGNYSIIEVFDLWNADNAVKELFLIKFWRAYRQKFHRLKTGKISKSYTYIMSKEMEMKINKLSEWHGKPKNRIIEMLISDAYDSLKNEGG